MAASLIDNIAELGSEEEDDDYDEEIGETRPKKANGANGIEDSSEEEEEDDEEKLRAVSHSPRFPPRCAALTSA